MVYEMILSKEQKETAELIISLAMKERTKEALILLKNIKNI